MMRPQPDIIERPEVFQRFTSAMKAIVAVAHSVIQGRAEARRREVAENPNRRRSNAKVKHHRARAN